jgi:hypothetical protein
MVYYGITMHTGNIGGNFYLNFFILGVVDIPAKLFVMATINRSGRKRIHCLCMLIGDGMVVGFTTTLPMEPVLITPYVVSSNQGSGEMYSIQHYVIKFVSDLRQVSGFLRVTFFPPPIKLTARI